MNVELAHDDPIRNCHRRYSLRAQRTLLHELELIVQWGRAGQPLRTRVESFRTASALSHRFWELLERRRRHGYVPLVSGSLAGLTAGPL